LISKSEARCLSNNFVVGNFQLNLVIIGSRDGKRDSILDCAATGIARCKENPRADCGNSRALKKKRYLTNQTNLNRKYESRYELL